MPGEGSRIGRVLKERAKRKLAQAVQARTDKAQEIKVHTLATVSAVSTAGGVTTDGEALVTVTVNGDDQVMPWIQPYTHAAPPANGDKTVVVLVDKSPVLLGKIVGFPVI